MVEARPQDPLGEQSSNAVAGLRDLGCQVIVETAQHGEFGEWFVGQPK